MKYIGILALVGFGYILGSVPFGYLAGKLLKDVDVRTKGSGNIGATNILRTLGLGPALVVLCCDLGKGALAAHLGASAHGTLGGALCGGAAWLGGAYSVFLGFQGGKGIGAGGGIALVTMPKVVAVLLPVWAVVVLLTRYVSLGSIIVAGLAPFAAYAMGYPPEYVVLAGMMGGLAILKHHSNIKRLIAGKERKLGEKAE
ncbi:MAG: glycerol-3-phosphate 1-O-acyltransferase PlsY [Firmicutes bacterium]|jgi:glycerol-3-phosphate acyltransferase PlsY|nr:glycerol-3-phosphate 1-O-acyltransferase PlsY [Bacillota bacterium]